MTNTNPTLLELNVIESLVQSQKLIYLNEAAVRRAGVFSFRRAVEAVREAYETHFKGDTILPTSQYLTYPGRSRYDRVIPLLGYLGGRFKLSGLKTICSTKENYRRGLPRASGTLQLIDPISQRPFCIMEASCVSAARTAAVSGLAIGRFSRPVIEKAAFIGCGDLARVHALMIAELYPSLRSSLVAFDKDPQVLWQFVSSMRSLGLTISTCSSAEEAVRDADIIIPMTTEDEPYVEASWIKPGSLYCAVSLLDPKLDVLRESEQIVVDDLEICLQEGRPLELLQREGGLAERRILTIGESVAREIPARERSSDKVFFNPMGTILTDLAVGLDVFHNAIAQGEGDELDA